METKTETKEIKLFSAKKEQEYHEKWQYWGSSFYGNGAFFAHHAKVYRAAYTRNPEKYFNKLVALIVVALHSNRGTYAGYCSGKSVGETFNTILFNIDRRATVLALTLA